MNTSFVIKNLIISNIVINNLNPKGRNTNIDTNASIHSGLERQWREFNPLCQAPFGKVCFSSVRGSIAAASDVGVMSGMPDIVT